MQKTLAPPAEFPRVLPLVLSILHEIQERDRRARLLQDAARVEPRTTTGQRLQSLLLAECQVQRVELERSRRELERLGCFLIALDPPLLAVRTRRGRRLACFLWQL